MTNGSYILTVNAQGVLHLHAPLSAGQLRQIAAVLTQMADGAVIQPTVPQQAQPVPAPANGELVHEQ